MTFEEFQELLREDFETIQNVQVYEPYYERITDEQEIDETFDYVKLCFI